MMPDPGDAAAVVARQVRDSIALKEHLMAQAGLIIQIATQTAEAFRRGNKVLLFGNGGSAADAEHIACELAGRFHADREPLPAIALSSNTASVTAIANDFGYDQVFARQLRGLVTKGDVVVGISTSGASANVIVGIQEAERKGAITVAFTGGAGRLGQIARYALSMPSSDTPRIQESHITAGHIISYLVEQSLFGTSGHAGASDE
jgi:D-sedoheptulose 7-phosphate isomerase